MAFARPTLKELLTRVSGDIAARTEGRAFIRRTVDRALGYAVAGVAHHLHGHLAWVRDQLFPQTADAEALSEWGALRDEARKQGAHAAGSVRFSGAGSVPDGALVQSDAGGVYRITGSAGAGTYTVQSVGTGAALNLDAGERILLVTPVAGVESEGVVLAPLSGGADIEDLEAYRVRVLDALRSASALYGRAGDYRRWALRREGVTEAWEFPRRMGHGTVSVGFMFGDRADVIPTPADVADMQAYLDGVRPADMRAVYVAAPIADALHILVTARGTMTQGELAEAVRAFLRTDVALEAPLSISQLDEVLSSVPGELSHTITSITATSRGISRVIALGGGDIAPVPWGLFTFGSLTLTVAP